MRLPFQRCRGAPNAYQSYARPSFHREPKLPCRHEPAALCCTKSLEFLAQTNSKRPEGPMVVSQHADNTDVTFLMAGAAALEAQLLP